MAPADYPRPDFQREDLVWESLNGPWDFLFDDEDVGLEQSWHHHGIPQQAGSNAKRRIEVPFVFQCEASGINERGVHEVLWYERTINDLRQRPGDGHRLLLRFGAVDYYAKVWLDGQFVGDHRGGHAPFDLDLTDAIVFSGDGGSKRLTIRVYDSAFDLTQPRGKQYWEPEPRDIFYTPSSGIWQNVWLERVPRIRIADSSHGTIMRSHDIDAGTIDARIAVLGRRAREKCYVEVEASLGDMVVSNSGRKDVFPHEDFVRFSQSLCLSDAQTQALPSHVPRESLHHNNLALWAPEHPTLYTLRIRLYSSISSTLLDTVTTTTGMRSITWTTGDGTLRLNHKPYFHALLLDQGYWPATLMTPPSSEALQTDIQLSKALGFVGCRKHQKVEDPRFYHCADRLGFLVWGEMAAGYAFSVEYAARFDEEWMAAVRLGINHPCVVAWTPVNESWGYPALDTDMRQRDHIRSLYHMTRTLDPTRPVNDNCGWEHVVTDLSTFHDYADAGGMAARCASVQAILGRGKNMFVPAVYGKEGAVDEGSAHRRGAPILCSEFGGVNIAAPEEQRGKGEDPERRENWGYTTASSSRDLLARLEGILTATVRSGIVCGVVWTQTADIAQEQNGLLTADRRAKVAPAEVKAVLNRAREMYLSARR